ncbi:MAG: Gfo/Idh/MocA family oxidoreductase [Planctomycetota bacterium]
MRDFSRRQLLHQTALTGTAAVAAYLGSGLRTRQVSAEASRSPNEQPVFGFIGTGIRYHTYHARQALKHGPCAGIADVDLVQAGRAQQVAVDLHRQQQRPLVIDAVEDYRRLLDRSDIDAVVIGSVDHWHTKQVIDALDAGKDVYCEKPVTLTIREGQQIEAAMKKSNRVVQVGTQQRTEFGRRFATAAAMLRDNRVGDIKRITACIGGSRVSGTLPKATPPKQLNWDAWLGQCPMVDYRSADKVVDVTGWGAGFPFSRAHRYYRWFYEYSGGKLTDWGAHHVDIAMWAMNKLGDDIGRIEIDPLEVEHPVPFDESGMPIRDDQFNCAVSFKVRCRFADGTEFFVRHAAPDLGFDNGIMFEGSLGRYLVNRGKLVGSPVERLNSDPLPNGAIEALYADPSAAALAEPGAEGYHMRNFVDCIKTRKTPASDMVSHNQMLNVCHAINVAMRLNRSVIYDPATQTFGDDPTANAFIEREQRAGYETA